MLKIRLTRVGKKNSPAYRVVVADHKKAVKRKFIEILGHYNPAANPKELVIDKEKALSWIAKGAQPSDTVKNLLCDLGILEKNAKTKKVFGKPTKKKDAGKEPEVKAEDKTEPQPEAPAKEAQSETAPHETENTPVVEPAVEEKQ